MTPELGRAIHAYLARGRSWVMMVQAEDVFEQVEQMNVPATTGQYPNWRLKLSPCLEEWAADARFGNLTEVLRRLRGANSDETAGRFQRGKNWRPERELLGGHNTKKNKENKVVPHRLPLRGHGS
jgi:hypothetical protein